MAKKKTEQIITGVFQGTSRGFGFLVPEDGKSREDDYFIPPRATGGAWDGDKVQASPDPETPWEEGRRTATVVRVTERANRFVTGTVEKLGRELWMRPDSDKLPGPIKISGKAKGVRIGEKIAVEMLGYGTAKTPPMGALRETFGPAGNRESSSAAILYHYEIDPEFPPAVLDAAARAPREVEKDALAGRTDLRNRIIITIDGASSKDLDDAVSLERDEQGRWVLGVHIADVSHYVQEKSPLDLEAWERGTSVYFADRVIPMLPVELSNGICSLNPGVDRLTISCFMTLAADGREEDHTICKSVIRSTERMTYEDCNKLLAGEDPDLEKRYDNILPMLKDMAVLAKVLEKRRKLRGSLDLETSESYIICDEHGKPVDIKVRKQGESEALIESFMLAANECVAKHLFDRHKPAVYRVHEKPSQDKAEGLKTMLAPFGYTFQEADSFALQKILEDTKGKPEAPIISTMVLRSLMKARYDVQNLGHFGLAAKYYCHFTSPIRRYPDLMVHRVLTQVLADEANPANVGKTMPWEKRMASVAARAADQSSQREVAAQNAEREIEKLYMAEYMLAHVGETMVGTVSGVTKFGLFVMLPSGVEGLIPAEALPRDHYHHDDQRMTLRGEHTSRVFSFGMPLTVVCAAADPGSGQITFHLSGEEPEAVPERPETLRQSHRHPGPRSARRNGEHRSNERKSGGERRSRPPRHKPGKGGKRRG